MVRKYVRKTNPQPGKGGGRPPVAKTSPGAMARALQLVQDGMTPEEAGEREGVVPRTLRREVERQRAKEEPPPEPATPTEEPKPAAEPAKPRVTRFVHAERAPEHLGPQQKGIWYLEREIDLFRDALATAEAELKGGNAAALGRMTGLSSQLQKLRSDLERHAPPAPPTADEVEARWKATRDEVLRKIEAGVKRWEERVP